MERRGGRGWSLGDLRLVVEAEREGDARWVASPGSWWIFGVEIDIFREEVDERREDEEEDSRREVEEELDDVEEKEEGEFDERG